MQCFDGPVTAVERGEFGWSGEFGGMAGDAQLRGCGLLAVIGGDVAFDQPGLFDVGKRQAGWCGQDSDGAVGGAAVPGVSALVCDRGGGPGQNVEGW